MINSDRVPDAQAPAHAQASVTILSHAIATIFSDLIPKQVDKL